MKKSLLILALIVLAALFCGCNNSNVSSIASASYDGDKTIYFITQSESNGYWTAVSKGAKEAAQKYKANISVVSTDNDTNKEASILESAINGDTAAVCIYGSDTNGLNSSLTKAKSDQIPVISYGGSIPNSPTGTIMAVASANNISAGRLAAKSMFGNKKFMQNVKRAKINEPGVILVYSKNENIPEVSDRIKGFIEEIWAECNEMRTDCVEISGNPAYNKKSPSTALISIRYVSDTIKNKSGKIETLQSVINNGKNIIGYFCPDESSADAILELTNNGNDISENGKFSNMVVIGYGSEESVKDAVISKKFAGAVTQDPYKLGYTAIETAISAINGNKINETVDTGCKFYCADNMSTPEISAIIAD